MKTPTTMPAMAPEPRLGSLPPVGWFVEEGDCVTVSVVAEEVVGVDREGKDDEVEVEVEKKENEFVAGELEVDSTELLGIDDIKELEILFNCSSGVAWKVSSLGFEQLVSMFGLEQQCHNPEAVL